MARSLMALGAGLVVGAVMVYGAVNLGLALAISANTTTDRKLLPGEVL